MGALKRLIDHLLEDLTPEGIERANEVIEELSGPSFELVEDTLGQFWLFDGTMNFFDGESWAPRLVEIKQRYSRMSIEEFKLIAKDDESLKDDRAT